MTMCDQQVMLIDHRFVCVHCFVFKLPRSVRIRRRAINSSHTFSGSRLSCRCIETRLVMMFPILSSLFAMSLEDLDPLSSPRVKQPLVNGPGVSVTEDPGD